jgi:hypothetical protein
MISTPDTRLTWNFEDDKDSMSDENSTSPAAKKAREPKKNSIPQATVTALVEGIPQYEKESFLVVGHKGGVRVALPLTTGVSRVYFYGNNDYSLIPQHEAITVFSEEQRKEGRKGGIMAEVDFGKGLDLALSALTALVEVVRNAKAPEPKLAKPKAPKKPKKAAAAPIEADETATDATPPEDETSSGDTASA